MDELRLRTMELGEWANVGRLIYESTNAWYMAQNRGAIFAGEPSDCEIFCRVYEEMDPGCCLVVEDEQSGQIVGSCFYHPRPTHFSVGIVNVHPSFFGKGVGRRMVAAVCEKADAARLPVRLVSSALNLDSFSLYTRAGFVPRGLFQDMTLAVPEDGLPKDEGGVSETVRPATLADVPALVALEREISGIDREKDFRFFLENTEGWKLLVLPCANGDRNDGSVDGFLASGTMIGPGVARTESHMEILLRAMLDVHRGQTPLFLVPADCAGLVAALYKLGAKNTEIHVAQIRGNWTPPSGIVVPSFLPESG